MSGRARRLWPRRLSAVLLALVAGIGFLALQRTPAWQALEGQALSWRFQLRGPLAPPPDIVIVAIDDAALEALGHWPLHRARLAEAVEALDVAGADVIGIDLLLLESEPGFGDGSLASVAAQRGNVVLASAFRWSEAAATASAGAVRDAAGAEPPKLLEPPEGLRRVVGLGHVNVLLDVDGRLRGHLPLLGAGPGRRLSLPVALALRHLGLSADAVGFDDGTFRLGSRRYPAGRGGRLLVNYYGPAGQIPTLSLRDLLAGRVPKASLAGKVVLVGATATGFGDLFGTPFSARLPGVEYFASVLGNLLDGHVLRRDRMMVALDAAAVMVGVLAALAAVQALPPLGAGLAGLALVVAWLAAGQWAFVRHDLWLSAVGPPLAVLATVLGGSLLRLVAERRGRAASERRGRNLARYVAPGLAELLAEQERPAFAGRRQAAAVLFTDLVGFTGLSETLGPERTNRLLTAFHETVERAVLAHGGVLTAIMGDGAMAVFGLPEPAADDPARALACARTLAADFDRWTPLKVGLGVHCGPVSIDALGGARQVQITATGDTVNVASRLEGLTRELESALVVSDALVAAVRGLGRAELLDRLVPCGERLVKGRRMPVTVWSLRA